MAILTAADYQDLVNEDLDGFASSYVANVLEAVELLVARHYGKPLTQQEFTEVTRGVLVQYGNQGALRVMARVTPVVSLSAARVYYTLTDPPQPLDISRAVIDGGTGEILIPFGLFATWRALFRVGGEYRVEITYTAGAATEVPLDVKRALALLAQEQIAADAQASRESTDDVIAYKVGEYSEQRTSYTDRVTWTGLGLGTRNSRIAQDILDRYYGTAGAVLL